MDRVKHQSLGTGVQNQIPRIVPDRREREHDPALRRIIRHKIRDPAERIQTLRSDQQTAAERISRNLVTIRHNPFCFKKFKYYGGSRSQNQQIAFPQMTAETGTDGADPLHKFLSRRSRKRTVMLP